MYKHSKRCRQDISCILAAPDASVRAQVRLCMYKYKTLVRIWCWGHTGLWLAVLQFKQNLTHAALMHKAGEVFATRRPCSTVETGLILAGFECIMLALLAVSVPVMLWRRSIMN